MLNRKEIRSLPINSRKEYLVVNFPTLFEIEPYIFIMDEISYLNKSIPPFAGKIKLRNTKYYFSPLRWRWCFYNENNNSFSIESALDDKNINQEIKNELIYHINEV